MFILDTFSSFVLALEHTFGYYIQYNFLSYERLVTFTLCSYTTYLVQVVNFGSNRVTLKISIDGLEGNIIQETGSAKTILTSGNVKDENSFNQPTKVRSVYKLGNNQ